MANIYPTIHNKSDAFGLPIYELRGTDIYPTVHNKRDAFGLPVFELRRQPMGFTWDCPGIG